jgi:hypothetical protein
MPDAVFKMTEALPDGFLPQDRARYEEIKPIWEERMKINPERTIKAKGEFKRPVPDVSLTEAALVKWTEVIE